MTVFSVTFASLIIFRLCSSYFFSLPIYLLSLCLSSLFQLFDIIVVIVPKAVCIAMYFLATCLSQAAFLDKIALKADAHMKHRRCTAYRRNATEKHVLNSVHTEIVCKLYFTASDCHDHQVSSATPRCQRGTHRASRSLSNSARMSSSRTGPLTFRMIVRVVSSMNSTRTWVTPPRDPVRPRT